MKILLIRHGEVAMKWEKRYTAEEYNEACERYDMADIEPAVRPEDMGDYRRIYVSTLKRSVQTREYLFPYASEQMVTQTPLLDEVPLRAYDDSPKIRPRWMYDLAGRLQWRIGGGSGQRPHPVDQSRCERSDLRPWPGDRRPHRSRHACGHPLGKQELYLIPAAPGRGIITQ